MNKKLSLFPTDLSPKLPQNHVGDDGTMSPLVAAQEAPVYGTQAKLSLSQVHDSEPGIYR